MTHSAPISLRAVHTLRVLRVLDTAQDERFQALVRQAAAVCDAPIALISLLDFQRQWFIGNVGLEKTAETPRDISFCQFTVLQSKPFVVADAQADPEFAENPLVQGAPHIRFYAGSPLQMSNGARVGSLCVIDRRPRVLRREQLDELGRLAADAARLLESRLPPTHALEALELGLIGGEIFQSNQDSGDAAVFIDTANTIRSWNEAAERLFGYTENQVVGQPAEILVPERLRVVDGSFVQPVASRPVTQYETVCSRSDGREFVASITLVADIDASGDMAGVLKLIREHSSGMATHDIQPCSER